METTQSEFSLLRKIFLQRATERLAQQLIATSLLCVKFVRLYRRERRLEASHYNSC